MPIVGIICYPTEPPPDPPTLDVPNFGLLQKARTTLSAIADPGDMLVQAQDVMALALAPVRRYLEIVEILAAFYNCTKAVPDAILQFSPEPIFNCLEDLAKKIAKIISYIPPMSYIRMGLGVDSYCIECIDAIIDLYRMLDTRLSGLVSVYTAAVTSGDVELANAAKCSARMSVPAVYNSLELIIFFAPAMDALLDPFIRLCPGGQALQPVKDALADVKTYAIRALALLKATPEGQAPPQLPGFLGGDPSGDIVSPILPIPKLGPILDGLIFAREALVTAYNFLAPLIGEDADKANRTLPTFQIL